jgi:hypothetical protein
MHQLFAKSKKRDQWKRLGEHVGDVLARVNMYSFDEIRVAKNLDPFLTRIYVAQSAFPGVGPARDV